MIYLRLPYPPSTNHYWLRNKNGGMRISPEGKAFRLGVLVAVRATKARKMAGMLSVGILSHPPDKRRRDIDNLLKATLDALQHAGLYADDNQISRLIIERGEPVKVGMLIVTVTGITI